MAQRTGGPARPVAEFLSGVRVFADGVAFSVRRPRLLALGLVPAAIAFVLLAAAVGIVIVFIRAETAALTWFAEGWAPWLHTLLRVLAGAALVGVVGVLAIIAHDRWRCHGRRLSAVFAPLLLVASLLSAEAGIGTVAYLFAHVVFLDRATWRRRVVARRGFVGKIDHERLIPDLLVEDAVDIDRHCCPGDSVGGA